MSLRRLRSSLAMTRALRLTVSIAFGMLAFASTVSSAAEPRPVKVVVLTMFENGEVSGDAPGELQLWVERNSDLEEIPFPLADYPL